MCKRAAGGRVRARQSHDLTGELRRGINVTSHGVGMLLAGTWLRGTGFERAIERAPCPVGLRPAYLDLLQTLQPSGCKGTFLSLIHI